MPNVDASTMGYVLNGHVIFCVRFCLSCNVKIVLVKFNLNQRRQVVTSCSLKHRSGLSDTMD